MSPVSPTAPTDRECLRAFARQRGAGSFRPVMDRYLAFVYSSAYRRTGNAIHAAEVTRAVFLVLAHRARRLRRKTVLAGWLFQITKVACRKLKRAGQWQGPNPRHGHEALPAANLWTRIAPEIDRALDRLPSKQRNAVLLCCFLNNSTESAAPILRTGERRVKKHVERGLKKLTKRLRKRGVPVESDALALVCAAKGCIVQPSAAPRAALSGLLPPVISAHQESAEPIAETVPELVLNILKLIDETHDKRPSSKLARRILNSLAWARWRRRTVIGVPSLILLFIALVVTAWAVDARTGNSRFITAFFLWSVKHEARTVPGLAQPARPWPMDAAALKPNASTIRSARDLYQTTNIWLAQLKFSREEWKALEPKRIGPLPNFLQKDGTVLLRHPEAQRSGLAGVLGFDFNWARADFEFGGVAFTNVASRFKGNGTYITSLYGWKRPFKVHLNKFFKGQKLAGMDELNFNNLANDRSYMSDALAYEFFRDAGVPAPRTAYAYLSVSVEGKWERNPLGLYVMVEPVDEAFAAEHFGSKKAPVFKPVTYELFKDLGDDWSAYAMIYDLKTKATPEQRRRVIDFARLVSHAGNKEFGERLKDFLDLDEFARFLAGEVLLSTYDSILADGQNFYLYLDPRSNKFGFIPWDLDLAWGDFFLLGTAAQRERASIWHPWVGSNRFLERVTAVEEFRKIYRAHLEDFSARLFVPGRLHQRIDQVASVIRGPIAAESDFRLEKFEQAVGDKKVELSQKGSGQGANRPVLQLKRFIENRAAFVRQQLDGKSKGVILERSPRK